MSENLKVSSRVILKANNEVLMSLGDTGSVKFLGGRMQQGESPLQAVVREGWEEAGLNLPARKLYELPYQNDGDGRPSYWFGVNTPRFAIESLRNGDDVVALFWVSLADVESRLTYDAWKEHWINHLLPNLR